MDKATDCVLKFIEESQTGINMGEAKEFICLVCGGMARAVKSAYNGHLHAKCEGCGIRIRE